MDELRQWHPFRQAETTINIEIIYNSLKLPGVGVISRSPEESYTDCS